MRMREISFLGLNFTVGKDKPLTAQDVETKINNAVENVKKSFTYDKLFTTGHYLEMLNSTRVTNPYETIATVYKAVKAICDNVPQADLELHTTGSQTDVDDPRLMELINNPNPAQDETEFRQQWAGYFALHGEAFIRKIQSYGQMAGSVNLPAELHNLDPRFMHEIVDKSTGQLVAWKYANFLDGVNAEYPVSEIIQSKDFNPYSKWRGLSPCKPVMEELQLDQSCLNFNLAFFKNDATPGFILSTDQKLQEDQRRRIREDIEKNHKGARNAFKTEIFESGLKPVASGSTHKDMEFSTQKEMSHKEILGIWRVPECLFNNTKDVNYSTMQGMMRMFWIYTLVPMMNKYRSAINRGIIMPYNPRVEIALDLLSVPAFQDELYTKTDAAKIFWDMGFTAQEVNDKLDLGFNDVDAPWRHEAWVAFNVQTAKNAMDNPRISEVVNDANAPAEQANETPKPAKKSVDARATKKAFILKNFERRAVQVESKMKGKITRYFMDLRAKALKTPLEKLEKGIVDVDWQKANESLLKLMKPLVWEGVQHGLAMGKDHAGEGKGIQDEADQHTFNSYVTAQTNKITQINETVKDQLATILTDTATEGASQSLTRDALAEVLKDGMRGVFNSAVTRSNLIARTETASAVNGGSWMYYKSIGVPMKSWVSADDDLVRPDHMEAEKQGSIPIDQPFFMGMQFPGDQNGDVSEIANCRCSLAPETE